MNTYRVDVSNDPRVPCGMCSIRYVGDNYEEAKRTFNKTEAGYDKWSNPNPAYGVLMSKWDNTKQEYVVLSRKGATASGVFATELNPKRTQ